jgi:hypothetical protein
MEHGLYFTEINYLESLKILGNSILCSKIYKRHFRHEFY